MDKKLYVELPPFIGRNVPIAEISKAMEKMHTISDLQYSKGFLNLALP